MVPLAIACDQLIDNTYDLRNIDPEVTVAGGLTVPLNNLNESIVLGDLLATNSILVADAAGNYRFQMNMDNQNIEFQVPQFSIPGQIVPFNLQLPFSFHIIGPSLPTISINQDLSSRGNKDFSFETTAIPEEITALESLSIKNGGRINFNFAPNNLEGADIFLKTGSTIILPDALTGIACNNPNIVVNGNVLTIVNNINIRSGFSLPLSFSGLQMPANQGIIEPQHFVFEGTIDYDFSYNLRYTGVPSNLPSELVIANTFEIEDMQVQDATVKLSKNISINDLPSIELEGLPEILSGGKSKIDLHDLNVTLDIQNPFPAAFELSSQLSTFATGGTKTHDFAIGPYTIATGENNIILNESNTPGISDMLMPIPSALSLDYLTASINPQDPITITLGQNYSATAAIGIDTPLAFGPEAVLDDISYSLDGFDFDLDANVAISEATLKMKYINTIPLEFKLGATALSAPGANITLTNKEGEALSTSPLTLEYCSVGQKEELEIKLKGENIKISDLKGLELVLSASSSKQLKGIQLNQNQGIELGDIQIVIDSGVTIGAE